MANRSLAVVLALMTMTMVSAAVTSSNRRLRAEERVKYINSVQKLWIASTDSPMADITPEQAHILGAGGHKTLPADRKVPPKRYSAEEIQALPASFDARDAWPDCAPIIGMIRDQSNCGSCWAMAAVSAMSDRLCIFNNQSIPLSAEAMLACSGVGDCKKGGMPEPAWQYWKDHGLPSEACRAYSLPWCDHHILENTTNPCPPPGEEPYPTPDCIMQCTPGYNGTWKSDLHFGQSVYEVDEEQNMMAELVKNGPFEVGFTLWSDFWYYKSGIYKSSSGHLEGGHNVKLIGYGVDNGVKYWTLANSWNTHWGENGFFRMIRGENDCGLEWGGIAGIPDPN